MVWKGEGLLFDGYCDDASGCDQEWRRLAVMDLHTGNRSYILVRLVERSHLYEMQVQVESLENMPDAQRLTRRTPHLILENILNT